MSRKGRPGRQPANWAEDPAAKQWIRDVEQHMTPKMESSGSVVSMVPRGKTDVKFAVELGMAIMLDKPIIALVQPGTHVPARLLRVADEIIEADLSTDAGRQSVMARVQEAMQKVVAW